VEDAATDAADDARKALERVSSPSNDEREGDGVGDDGSFLHSRPQPRPRDFLPVFFGVFFGMTVMLILRYLVRLNPHSTTSSRGSSQEARHVVQLARGITVSDVSAMILVSMIVGVGVVECGLYDLNRRLRVTTRDHRRYATVRLPRAMRKLDYR